MSIGFLLLLLFIIFIAWPVIRAMLTVNRLRRQARQAFEEAGRNYDRDRRDNEARTRKPGWSRAPEHKKVINPTDGEYVEWEEISVQQTTTQSTEGNGASDRCTVEQQITDVEWEDIKP